MLLLPAVAVFLLASFQHRYTTHFRYVLPAFGFAFVFMGRAYRQPSTKRQKLLVAALVVWTVVSSLNVFPHSLSYFNELAGGPRCGHNHLVDSNIDWGQDLFRLKAWYDQHREARPLYTDVRSALPLDLYGIESDSVEYPLRPGWYAVSVHRLREHSSIYEQIPLDAPDARVGFSIYVYHVAPYSYRETPVGATWDKSIPLFVCIRRQ